MQKLLLVFDLEISYSEAKFEIASIVELALWKAKIGEESEPQQQIDDDDRQISNKNAKIDQSAARKKCRIKCGADVVLPTELHFSQQRM